jgi:hypothetical protein
MRKAILGLVLVLAACGGDGGSDFDALYDPPTGQASSTLFGRWGGSDFGFDTRWVIGTDEITLANRCGDRTVGLTVAAEVTQVQIRILESGSEGDDNCFVTAAVGVLTACPADPTMQFDCFDLEGLTLTLHGSSGTLDLFKIED